VTPTTARRIRQDLIDAGPTIEMPLANEALGISRAHGYALAKRGEYPVRLLRLGSSYRVVTSELWALLGIDPEVEPQAVELAAGGR